METIRKEFVILVSDKVKLKLKKSIKYDKRGQFLMLRAEIHNVDITVSNNTAITVVKQKL